MNKSSSRDKQFDRPEKKLQATFQHNCFITI